MKTVTQWFDEYGESHQNPVNKTIHWICVPVIFFCVVSFLSLVHLFEVNGFEISLAHAIMIPVVLFYFRLSAKLALAATAFALLCLVLAQMLSDAGIPLGIVAFGLFTAAWIGQFYGHHIEGKKPSFLKDLQFLLIGPFWLLGFVYDALGIRYR